MEGRVEARDVIPPGLVRRGRVPAPCSREAFTCAGDVAVQDHRLDGAGVVDTDFPSTAGTPERIQCGELGSVEFVALGSSLGEPRGEPFGARIRSAFVAGHVMPFISLGWDGHRLGVNGARPGLFLDPARTWAARSSPDSSRAFGRRYSTWGRLGTSCGNVAGEPGHREVGPLNESLRRALFDAGLTEVEVAAHLGVVPKTVRRWMEGRLPYPRHRWPLANLVGLDEDELWPEVRAARIARSRPEEVTAVYPHRWSVALDTWRDLFASAGSEIAILVYSGLFLAEDAIILRELQNKALAGVRVRIALGDPDCPQVSERGHEEGIADAMAAKIRNALVLYRELADTARAEIRLHQTVLYNSLYRADDQLLVNQHCYGSPAAHSPVFHLRLVGAAEMFQSYCDGFERIWANALPAPAIACERASPRVAQR